MKDKNKPIWSVVQYYKDYSKTKGWFMNTSTLKKGTYQQCVDHITNAFPDYELKNDILIGPYGYKYEIK